MQKYLALLVLSFLMVPAAASAAPLTNAQASNLITVVQSFPGVPASTFTGLITAFSNITSTQADSLISVVQAAPGVPASSFVGLLIAFTQDTQTTIAPPVQPSSQPTQQTQQSQNTTGSGSVESNQPTPTMDALTVAVASAPTSILSQGAAGQTIAQLTITANQSYTLPTDVPTLLTLFGISLDDVSAGLLVKKNDGSTGAIASDLKLSYTNGPFTVNYPAGKKPKTPYTQDSLANGAVVLRTGQVMNVRLDIVDQLNGATGSFTLDVGDTSKDINVIAPK